MFWYVLFYKNLIVLTHDDNNFLLYFDIYIKFIISLIIYIKFIISLIILTMKKWPHLTWCVLFNDFFMKKKKCLREKKFVISKTRVNFGNYLTQVLILRSSCSHMFFKIGVLQKFEISTRTQLCWPLQTFFYRTPTVAASGFSRQKILFSAESGIYCWHPLRLLLQTPLERRVKD